MQNAPKRLPVIRGTTDGAKCFECPFAKMGQPNRPVTGEGVADPKWIVVGEGPGHNEVLQNRPFIGASGRLVTDILSRIGTSRDTIWMTNVTLCRPPHAATEASKRAAREACSLRLQRELQLFPDRPVLALGSLAAQGFIGDRLSITKMSGAYYEVDIAQPPPWTPVAESEVTRRREDYSSPIVNTTDGDIP